MQPRGLVVSFTQAALFPSGEDVISPESYGSLKKVAAAIAKIPNPVRLEGHTDSVPISTSRFHSNWELSAARSIALMDLHIRPIRRAARPACRLRATRTMLRWRATIPKTAARGTGAWTS